MLKIAAGPKKNHFIVDFDLHVQLALCACAVYSIFQSTRLFDLLICFFVKKVKKTLLFLKEKRGQEIDGKYIAATYFKQKFRY